LELKRRAKEVGFRNAIFISSCSKRWKTTNLTGIKTPARKFEEISPLQLPSCHFSRLLSSDFFLYEYSEKLLHQKQAVLHNRQPGIQRLRFKAV
jgi:hypothetical protein